MNAANRQKNFFDNINIDWNLSHDDGSTDFSDDETVVDDRVCPILYLTEVVIFFFFIYFIYFIIVNILEV